MLPSRRITKRHRATLEPFSKAYERLFALDRMSDRELNELGRACDAVTPSNCSWSEFRVAKILKPEILAEEVRRDARRKRVDLPKLAVTE